MKRVLTAVLIVGSLLVQQASATAIISDTFNDLSAWTTFGTPSVATTDTETDGRSVWTHNQSSTSDAIIQQSFAAVPMFGAGAYDIRSVMTFRADRFHGALYPAGLHNVGATAGQFDTLNLYYFPSVHTLQVQETVAGASPVDLFNGPITAFPVNDSATGYGDMIVDWLAGSAQWRVSTVIFGSTNVVGTFSSNASGGGINMVEMRMTALTTGDPDFFVDRYELTQVIPEPGTGMLALAGAALIVWRRKKMEW